MDYYLPAIALIDVFVLGIMCFFARFNETLRLKQRRWFTGAFVLIMAISLMELVTLVFEGMAALRLVNILANYLGFGLSPLIPLCLTFALDEERNIRRPLMAEGLYLVLLAACYPFKLVFYVDEGNNYTRGSLFGIYVAAYSLGVLYLLWSVTKSVGKYQNTSKNLVYLIGAFTIGFSLVQVFLPHIRVSWLCVTLIAILYYIYCNTMWQQLDGLTGLLNQSSYLNRTRSLNSDYIFITFDLDNFKLVNDTYGHLTGDRCLKATAESIMKAYAADGLCYRIGGDEFFVLLRTGADPTSCYKTLIDELNFRRIELPMLPYVSAGSARFEPGDDVEKVKTLADRTMYRMKKMHKLNMQS